MKKIILFLSFILITQTIKSQKISPFRYKGKWGIVDDKDKEIKKPEYNKLRLFRSFTYAEFDGKTLYNLKTGTKTKAFGKVLYSEVKINNKEYDLFSNNKKSVLIDLVNNDTIHLSLPYTEIKQFNNEKSIYLAYLDYENINFLKLEKEVTTLLNEKIAIDSVEIIENESEEIVGVSIKRNKKIYFYDSNLKLLKKIKLKKEITKQRISSIYQTNITYSIGLLFDPVPFSIRSWKISSDYILNDYYFIDKKNYLRNKNDKTAKYKVSTKFFDGYRTIEIKEKELLFFNIFDYSNAMVPIKYLE